MSSPALHEALDYLDAEARERSGAGVRPADVVSFPMAKIINLVDAATAHYDARRLLMIKATQTFTRALEDPNELEVDDLDEYAAIIVRLKRALRDFARPHSVEAGERNSLQKAADDLRSGASPQDADDRLACRQADRLDACAKACEAARIDFVIVIQRAVVLMEATVAGNASLEDAMKRAIARQSIERYPVINEYLAS